MFIDIHVHTRRRPGPPRSDGQPHYCTPEQLIERYDEVGIQSAVILPDVGSECTAVVQSNEEVLEICERWPDRFIPFCNVDPRWRTNSPDAPLDELLGYYKEQGCRGVGEVTANLPFNHPMVENLFAHCQVLGLPLTFHVAPRMGGCYGLYDEPGLPLLEGALRKFPSLVFLGHSGDFWKEIAHLDTPEKRASRPTGPVEQEGRVPRLMRAYPNLHGDLSAGSGYTAVTRDPEFGVGFLNEFQDRLYFGTDICAPSTRYQRTRLVGFLEEMRDEGRISEECFDKISHRNAVRLLGL